MVFYGNIRIVEFGEENEYDYVFGNRTGGYHGKRNYGGRHDSRTTVRQSTAMVHQDERQAR